MASIMSTDPVGPAFLPTSVSGAGGVRPSNSLGSSMMDRTSLSLRASSSTFAPTLTLKWLNPPAIASLRSQSVSCVRRRRSEDAPSEPGDLLVVVSKPSDRRGVRRVSLLLDPCEPLLLAGLLRAKELERFRGRDGVGDVWEGRGDLSAGMGARRGGRTAKRGGLDEFLGCEVGDELPERLAFVTSIHCGGSEWEQETTRRSCERPTVP